MQSIREGRRERSEENAMRKTPTRKLAAYFLLIQGMASLHAPVAHGQFPSDLDKLYADESHCLVSPEIRSDKDKPNLVLL